MNKNKFKQDFEYYVDLIENGDNFSYARYADGQVRLMKGQQISMGTQAYLQDKWSSPNKLTKVGLKLQQTLNHKESNYHYAISAHSDSVQDCQYLMSKIENPNITFANLWINANYQNMKKFYQNLKHQTLIICNNKALACNFPFPVSKLIRFPDDCIRYWETHGEEYLNGVLRQIKQLQNKIVFVSAGPVSQILIHQMYIANSLNKYIDVGSSLDEYIHRRKTRPFMNEDSSFSKQISYFRGIK